MAKQAPFIQTIIKQAGEAVRNAIPTAGVIQKEGRSNIVTAADLASEKIIMDGIKNTFPNDEILSEETENNLGNPLTIDRLWVIDPIDGTNNFRYQRNYSCISIGYVENGVIKAGGVYDPFRDELFLAEKGQGATLNSKPIHVNDQTDLGKATVATDNSYDPAGTKLNLETVLKFDPMPWILMKGSAVLTACEVASGRIDTYIHTAFKPWDMAAAMLIVEEAGGLVRNKKGEELNFMSTEAVMGNPTLVEECVRALKK